MMDLMINQPTSTAFYMKNNFWTKIPKNGHCECLNLNHKTLTHSLQLLYCCFLKKENEEPSYLAEIGNCCRKAPKKNT